MPFNWHLAEFWYCCNGWCGAGSRATVRKRKRAVCFNRFLKTAPQKLKGWTMSRFGEENSVRPEVCSTSRIKFPWILTWSNNFSYMQINFNMVKQTSHICKSTLTWSNKLLTSANQLYHGRTNFTRLRINFKMVEQTSHICKSTLTWLNKLITSENQLLHGRTNISCLQINFNMVEQTSHVGK